MSKLETVLINAVATVILAVGAAGVGVGLSQRFQKEDGQGNCFKTASVSWNCTTKEMENATKTQGMQLGVLFNGLALLTLGGGIVAGGREEKKRRSLGFK